MQKWMIATPVLCLLWVAPLSSPSGDELTLSHMRYKKGLELIRMLYEKILSLDHHFSGVRADQYVQALGNPLSYAPFMKWAGNFPAPDRFENPYLSASWFIAEMRMGASSRADADKIVCLLDFSLRVHSDLRLIAYETDFLMNANYRLLEECRELFGEYTKAIGYQRTLEECRKTDDWEAVSLALDQKIQSMRAGSGQGAQQLLRDHINLEFSVDRLLNFLENYQVHIEQGVHYYQKFKRILSLHAPGPSCAMDIPEAWTKLGREVDLALDSFHQAFQVPELKGSKLKDLLYGFSD